MTLFIWSIVILSCIYLHHSVYEYSDPEISYLWVHMLYIFQYKQQDLSQGQESSPDSALPITKNLNVKTLTFC